MTSLAVRLYADGPGALEVEDLVIVDVKAARSWASARIAENKTFSRARIYHGQTLLSEVGYRINRPIGGGLRPEISGRKASPVSTRPSGSEMTRTTVR